MTSIVRRPARSLLPRLLPGVDHLFDDLFREPFAWFPGVTVAPWPGEGGFAPRVDVYQTEQEVVVKAELPGVAKEDIEIVAEDGHLTLRGQVKREEEVEEEGYHRRERMYGQFERLIHLPAEIDEQKVTAKYENGVLEIRAPKKEPEPKGTKIKVS